MEKPLDIKKIKKGFKNYDECHRSEDAFFFCMGYTVALYDNSLITKEEEKKLIKYVLYRSRRR